MRGGYKRPLTPLPPSVIAKRLKAMADNLALLVVWRNEAETRRKARAIQRAIDKKAELYREWGLEHWRRFCTIARWKKLG